MARRIKDVTKDYLENVPLPTHGSTYTVISHKSIIDYAYQELANHGFGIVGEEYRCTHDGQIAQGIYRLQYGSDPEMSVMFAWTNSYNKKIRFKCAVGGYVSMNNTVMLSADMGSYSRKHTGSADADTIASMQSQIANATMYYNQLVQDKEEMKKVELSRKRQAELLGVLFADHQILNTEQASIVLQQMEKPSFFYNGGRDTLWAFYNHITIALQNSHPQTWMEDQRMLHMCLIDELANSVLQPDISLIEEPVLVDILDPLASNYGEPENQTNLLVQIAEITKDDSVLWGAQHKITENHAFSMAQLAGVKAPEDIVIHIESDEEYAQRVAEIEGEPEMTELPDNQVVQNGSDFDIDLHQSDEMILDTHEVVKYTDPVGNTFELPSIQPEVAPARVKFAIDDTEEEVEVPAFEWEEPQLAMTPEEIHEHQDEIDQIIANEVETPVVAEVPVSEPSNDLDFSLDFEDEDDDEPSSSHDFFL
jgi:hypothetical protein